ncbi:DUF1877 family protein [Streptomyces echinoruber]|uniref:DUF1877 family protein n=1 Tax=Streptomyces echinoruber TaxID=68898 RepID=UPI00167E1B74|nr:DUF1877 family protein [Streptomyces echinoruber]
MGFWMHLTRHDAARVAALLDHPGGARAGRARLYEAWENEDWDDERRDDERWDSEWRDGERWDDTVRCAAASYGTGGDSAPRLPILESAHVHRAWQALHILLTGADPYDEEAVAPVGDPAWNAVLGGARITRDGDDRNAGAWEDLLLLMPDEVAAVDGFLRALDRDELIRRRHPFLREVGPYSFSGWTMGSGRGAETGDMVQSGVLANAFDTLRGFYVRAAAAGNVVVKNIG